MELSTPTGRESTETVAAEELEPERLHLYSPLRLEPPAAILPAKHFSGTCPASG